jgi:hypothetical protein
MTQWWQTWRQWWQRWQQWPWWRWWQVWSQKCDDGGENCDSGDNWWQEKLGPYPQFLKEISPCPISFIIIRFPQCILPTHSDEIGHNFLPATLSTTPEMVFPTCWSFFSNPNPKFRRHHTPTSSATGSSTVQRGLWMVSTISDVFGRLSANTRPRLRLMTSNLLTVLPGRSDVLYAWFPTKNFRQVCRVEATGVTSAKPA